jgi:ATP-dependent Lon protease
MPGYIEDEKLAIAKRYLVKRQLASAGLTEEQCKINEGVLLAIIRDYTREAGVRNLERQIGAICRHVAMRIAEGSATHVDIAVTDLQVILGSKRFEQEIAMRTSVPGVATGLAWTPAGGDILFVEATSIPGRGKLILTGQLGDVMKESAQAALSLIKSRASEFGIDAVELQKSDVHVHVPAGAIPKDGPSAGVAMFLALTSLLTGRTIRNDTAMTGEISLRGLVLPIGGVKERSWRRSRLGSLPSCFRPAIARTSTTCRKRRAAGFASSGLSALTMRSRPRSILRRRTSRASHWLRARCPLKGSQRVLDSRQDRSGPPSRV